MLKLFFYKADPSNAAGGVSGGAGVVAAESAEAALALLLRQGEDVYMERDREGNWVHVMPEEIVMPAQAGVLFYEGVAE